VVVEWIEARDWHGRTTNAATRACPCASAQSKCQLHAYHQVDARVLLALHGWEGRHGEGQGKTPWGLTKGEGGIVHCVKVNFCVTKMSKFKFRNKFRNLRRKKGAQEARAPIETGVECLGINK
jgi:hypothetical protein